MKLLEGYVWKQWIKTLIGTLLVMIGILILEGMYREFQELLRYGASISQILLYYTLQIPGFLHILLPIAVFISVLLSLGKLHQNNEIIAMRVSGLSLFQITRWVWISGFLLCLLMLYIDQVIIPKTEAQAEQFLIELEAQHHGEKSKLQGKHQLCGVTFDSARQHRLWILEFLDAQNGEAKGISVYERNPNGKDKISLTANSGKFLEGQWHFYGVEESLFDEEGNEIVQKLSFDEKIYPDFNEFPAAMAAMQKRPKDLSFKEINILLSFLAPETPLYRTYAVLQNFAFATCWTTLVAMICAIPFAIRGVRVNPMVNVAKATTLLFVFYILLNTCQALGTNGHLPIVIAAWLPNVILLGLGWKFLKEIR